LGSLSGLLVGKETNMWFWKKRYNPREVPDIEEDGSKNVKLPWATVDRLRTIRDKTGRGSTTDVIRDALIIYCDLVDSVEKNPVLVMKSLSKDPKASTLILRAISSTSEETELGSDDIIQ
jgi:hypothetical protein